MPDSTTPPAPTRHLSAMSAMSICTACMIGSGIFSITGLLGPALGSGTNVILAWVFGGVLALAGALTVAELAAQRPERGALYVAACETMGPSIGFLNGTVTVLVGYVAANAYIAGVIGAYLEPSIPWCPPVIVATVTVLLLTLIHARWLHAGVQLNDLMNGLKIILLLVFATAGLCMTVAPTSTSIQSSATPPAPWSPVMGAAVVSISFAYLGWGAAADVAGEIKQPKRNLPLAILGSITLVTTLYVLVNLAFVHAIDPVNMVQANGAPIANIGSDAAHVLFGPAVGQLMTYGIVAVLLSTLSTMIFAGGRVLVAMSTYGQLPPSLAQLSPRGVPTRAITIQMLLCLPFLWLPTLGSLLDYIGLLITICSAMSGVAVLLRRRRVHRVVWSMPLYPVPVVIFLALSSWLAVSAIIATPLTALYSGITIVVILMIRPLLSGPVEQLPPDHTVTSSD